MNQPPQLLIVDEKPSTCYTLQYILDYYGYKAFVASNGEEAQKLLQREQFDLVLLEVPLPGQVNANEIIRIASLPQSRAMIVVLTERLAHTLPLDYHNYNHFPNLDKTASPYMIAHSVSLALAQRSKLIYSS